MATKKDPALDPQPGDPHHTPAGAGDPNAPTLFPFTADGSMTEQERDTGSALPGVGPVTASAVSPGPVETIEDQGIGPRTPYPTGDPKVPGTGTTVLEGDIAENDPYPDDPSSVRNTMPRKKRAKDNDDPNPDSEL